MNRAGEAAGVGGEPQQSFRGDRGDHVQTVPGTGRLDHGGLPDGGPGGAGVVVRADPRLVTEVDRRPVGLGLGADRRELLVAPPLDRLRVGLPGPPQRPLRGQAQGAQQPTHADRGQRDPELPADQRAHHVPGPQREPELQLPRVGPGDQRVEPAHLLTRQLRRPTRHRPRLQRVPAALPVLGQPPVHRASAHAQRRRDVLRVHPGLDRVHRAQSHRLQRLVVQLAAVVLAHTALSQKQKIKSAYLRLFW
jgi:hypothetical protein